MDLQKPSVNPGGPMDTRLGTTDLAVGHRAR